MITSTYTGIHRQRGVTLLELMLVVVIIAIISSFAYPFYSGYIVEAKRAAASSALLRVADRQQQFFLDNKSFADDLTDLGFPADPWVIAKDGRAVDGDDPGSVYSLSLSNVGATTYTATAAPLNGQLAADETCGSLTLTQAGARGASGSGTSCW